MIEDTLIPYESGDVFVLRDPEYFAVCRSGPTHATVDSAYTRDVDGLSLAISRAMYLAHGPQSGVAKEAFAMARAYFQTRKEQF